SSSSNEPWLRVSTPTRVGRSPVTSSMRRACSESSWANALPTVPWPSSPMWNSWLFDVTGAQVLVALAADHHASIAVAAEDHWGPGHAVVVVGQRVPVGAGGRG